MRLHLNLFPTKSRAVRHTPHPAMLGLLVAIALLCLLTRARSALARRTSHIAHPSHPSIVPTTERRRSLDARILDPYKKMMGPADGY